ncbi:hypothetical protein [Serratia sp. Tan611]|uniref:hypothetical protein n=1 Tax=Serratia sp. Tan611 TaxID=2773264 RepID=UPI001AF9A2EB|nr:protein of unknown function [Serratia sp. Tan611]
MDPLGLRGCSPKNIKLTKDGVKHVKERHVGNKLGWEHKSKWTMSNGEWKSTVRSVFRNPDRIIKDGERFIYEKTIKNKKIGITPEGVELNKVRVVVESNGDLVTEFPQEIFREIKPNDSVVFLN